MKAQFALVTLALIVYFAGTTQAELYPPSALVKVGSAKTRIGILASYFYSPISRNWNEANRDCKETHNGQLVAITSQNVNDEVEYIIDSNNLGGYLWTDGRYDAAGIRWLWWTKRAPMTSYTYRPPGATIPTTTGATASSCMVTARIGASFVWTSQHCTASYRYICVSQD